MTTYEFNIVHTDQKAIEACYQFTRASIWAGLVDLEVKPAKRPTDALIDEQVSAVKRLTTPERVELYAWLIRQKQNVIPSKFDMATLVPEDNEYVKLSPNLVETNDGKREAALSEVEEWCNSQTWYCGGVQAKAQGNPDPLGVIIRSSIAVLKKKNKETKAASTGKVGTDAVPKVLADRLADSFVTTVYDAQAMQGYYTKATQKNGKVYRDAIMRTLGPLFSTFSPEVLVTDRTYTRKDNNTALTKQEVSEYKAGVYKGEVLVRGIQRKANMLKYEGYKLEVNYVRPSPYTITSDVFTARAKFSAEASNLSKKGVAKIARDTFLGIPFAKNTEIDHVIALHDAGVVYGNSVLCITANTNLVACLRSNFGPKIWGQGALFPLLRAPQWQNCAYDFVYFPDDWSFNTSGKAYADAHTQLRDKLAKLNLNVKGKLIFKCSPLAFYHPLMNALLHEYNPSDYSFSVVAPESVWKAVSTNEDPQGRNHETVYDAGDQYNVYPEKIDYTLDDWDRLAPRIGHDDKKVDYTDEKKILLMNRFGIQHDDTVANRISAALQITLGHDHEAMLAGRFANKLYPMKVTMSSVKGNVLVSEGIQIDDWTTGRRILGDLFLYQKMCIRNVWWNGVYSDNSYTYWRTTPNVLADGSTIVFEAGDFVTGEWTKLIEEHNEEAVKSAVPKSPAVYTEPSVDENDKNYVNPQEYDYDGEDGNDNEKEVDPDNL